MNLLINDSDLTHWQAIGTDLQNAGHTVALTTTDEEVFELIGKKGNIHMILVDAQMPVLKAPLLMPMLRKNYPEQLPTLVIISGKRNGEALLKKIDIRYDLFLPKPINFEMLTMVMDEIEIANSKAQKKPPLT